MIPPSVHDLLLRKAPVAVVGASADPSKYGDIISRDLERRGYPVMRVNPAHDRVGDAACHATVADLPEIPAIVDFVVPPRVALAVVEGLPDTLDAVLWFQPGSFDAAVVAAAEARGGVVIAGPCIMVEARD